MAIGDQDILDLLITQNVLVFAGLEVAAGVDKQDVFIGLGFAENQDRGRDAGAIEQLFRQTDNCIQQIFFNQLLANLAFAGATEEHAVRHDHRHASGLGLKGFDHVQDKGVIALGFRRNATLEAAKLVVLCFFMAPFVQRKRRVGGDDIEFQQLAILVEQLGVADGVAPFDFVVVLAVEKHVHLGQ